VEREIVATQTDHTSVHADKASPSTKIKDDAKTWMSVRPWTSAEEVLAATNEDRTLAIVRQDISLNRTLVSM